MSENEKIVEIPILTKFIDGKQIGMIQINSDCLPKHPHYCFAIGGTIQGRASNRDVTSFKLTQAIVSTDDEYKRYLDQFPPKKSVLPCTHGYCYSFGGKMLGRDSNYISIDDIHFPDIWFSIRIKVAQSYADVLIYKMESTTEEGEDSYLKEDTSENPSEGTTFNIDEAKVFAEGHIKWDGCCNFDLGYLHFCEAEDIENFGVVLGRCRVEVLERLG